MSDHEIHITEAIKLLENWFTQRTCQLFLLESGQKESPFASAFLLDLEEVKVLVTAGHVISEGRFDRFCFPNKITEGMTALNKGTWYPSGIVENLGSDKEDFAYLILDQEFVSIFEKNDYRFIHQNNIDLNHTPSPNCIYTAVGFRYRKTQKIGIDRHSQLDFMINFGASYAYYEPNYDPEIHILFRNERKLTNLKNKNRELTGRLDGMSGGALWNTDLHHYYDPQSPDIKLVGILQEYNSEVVCSCNIKRLMEVMKKRKQIK